MKIFALLFIVLFCAPTFAQELPRIAVYVTGDVSDNEKKALGTRMTTALVKSGQYQAVERTEEFLNKLDAEHVKQRSGAIDDGQISQLGKQFGVQFVCVADITPVKDEFLVSARIINVETAEIVVSGEAASPMKNVNDLMRVSNLAVKNMFGKQSDEPTELQTQSEAPNVRKLGYYLAARYAMPWGGMPASGVINLESGLVWKNGMFLGLDINLGHTNEAYGRVMIGGGFDLGGVYNLSVENLQFIYGGAAGLWLHSGGEYYYEENYMYSRGGVSILAPFIKLRWKILELSYRGLLGVSVLDVSEKKYYTTEENDYYYDYDNSYYDGLSWYHQVMLGLYFSTKMLGEKTNDAPKVRKHDWYWAARSAPTWGSVAGVPPWQSFNLEGGLVWGNGMFLGIDAGLGIGASSALAGAGLNIGNVYVLPVANLQFVYGGAVGMWLVGEWESTDDSNYRDIVNFFAPFIKLRWKFLELSYRGLLGIVDGGSDAGFGWNNHQIMFGTYFETSKRVK